MRIAHRRSRVGYARSLAIVLGVGGTLSLAAACGGESGASASDTIKIGMNLEMTGVASTLGPHALIAAEMARDEINEAGGIDGREVELVVEDNRSTPEQASIAVNELLREDVVAIVGPVQSTQAAVAFPTTNRAEIVSMSPGSAKPGLTAENRPWAFRNALLDDQVATGIVQELVETEGIERTGIVVDGRDAYSNNYGNVVLPAVLKEAGVEVTRVLETQSGQRDFSVEVTSLKRAGVDSVALNTLFEDGAVFMKEAQRQGLDVPIYGGASMAVPQTVELAGDAAEGIYAGSTFVSTLEDQEVQAFVDEYTKRAKEELPEGSALLPGYIDAGAYETVMLIAEAMKGAEGDIDAQREQVREELEATDGFQGLGTELSMNEDGDVVKPIMVLQVQDGNFKRIADVEVSE